MYIQNMSLQCGWMCIYSRCKYSALGVFDPSDIFAMSASPNLISHRRRNQLAVGGSSDK